VCVCVYTHTYVFNDELCVSGLTVDIYQRVRVTVTAMSPSGATASIFRTANCHCKIDILTLSNTAADIINKPFSINRLKTKRICFI
jgi:hypothetical protein